MKETIKYVLKITLLFALGLPVSCDEDNDVELPILTTLDANNIKCSTAYSGGLISEDGGGEISSRGVCWNTSPNPTIEDSEKSEDGAEIGSFNSLLPNLTHGTSYYVRAYATNEAGTAYGNEISFTTICELPVLTTMEANNITSSSANSGGLISEDGGGEISSRGVCWNTSPNPTIEDSEKSEDGAEIGSFNSLLPNLTSGTTYYVRAYATNEAGTAYGNEISFTTICEQPTSADFVLGHIDDYNDVVLFESGFIDRCDGWGFEVQVSHSLNLPDGLFLEMTISDVIANVYFDGAPVRIGDNFVIPNDDRRIRVGFGSVYDESGGYPECVLTAECKFTLRIKGEVQDKSLQKYDCHYYNGGGVTNTTYFWSIYSISNEDECCFDNSQ